MKCFVCLKKARLFFCALAFFSIGMVSDAKAHDRPQPTARAPFHVYSFDGVDLSHSSIDGRVGSGGDIFLRNTGVGRKQYREEDTLLSAEGSPFSTETSSMEASQQMTVSLLTMLRFSVT